MSSDWSVYDDRMFSYLDQSNDNTHLLRCVYITQERRLYIWLYPSQQFNQTSSKKQNDNKTMNVANF